MSQPDYPQQNPYGSQFGDEQRDATPPTEKGNFLLYCLGGCLVMFVLLAVLAGIGVYWAATRGVEMAVTFAQESAIEGVRQSELAEDDKQEIITQINRVAEAYKRGEISNEKMGRVFEKLAEGPLISVGMVYFIEQQYVASSGLSQEEKDQAHRTLERAARGVYEKKIDPQELEQVAEPISRQGADGQMELKEQVTDEELRDFLARLQTLVEQREIPDEPFEIDIGDEVRKAVDEALAD